MFSGFPRREADFGEIEPANLPAQAQNVQRRGIALAFSVGYVSFDIAGSQVRSRFEPHPASFLGGGLLRHHHRLASLAAAAAIAASPPASAQGTKTYTYDALGRLVVVQNSGGPNDQTTSTFDYDKAGNRTQVSTNGSSNSGGGGADGGGASVGARQGFVVTPLGGYALIFYRD